MSKKGKNDTDKIKFFEINEEGSIASAVPGKIRMKKIRPPINRSPKKEGSQVDASIHQREPQLMNEEDEVPAGTRLNSPTRNAIKKYKKTKSKR